MKPLLPSCISCLVIAAGLGGALLNPTTAPALTVTVVTSDNGYPAHEVQWTDAAGLPRSAVMVDQNSTGSGPYTGFLRRYTYQVDGATRTCTGTENYATGGDLEFSGDGFVQNHTSSGGDYSTGNGVGTKGTTTVTLQGTSHAIITYSIPTYKIDGKTVPTTVQWFFADGTSHPVFSISQDSRANTAGNLGADSRTPYGDMAYDGDGLDALVGGVAWGDQYTMFTEASEPEELTENTGWQDVLSNTIPFAMQWAEPATVDAEMGHVATLPLSLSDQGADTQTSNFDDPPDLFDPRTMNVPGGPLPPANTWAYQITNDTMPTNGDPTDSKRLAWQSNFGRVGGFDNYGDTSLDPTQYSQHSTDPVNQPLAGTRVSGLMMGYSTYIVLGVHNGGYANGAVGAVVTQMENYAASTLSATVGTPVASGPAGVGSISNASITYTPTGYNPTFATWEITAAQNAVNATLTSSDSALLDHPVFVVQGYTATTLPASVSINGNSTAGTDYFATLDASTERLFVTANLATTSPINLVVTPAVASPGTLGFGASTYSVNEDAGSITVHVLRSGGSSGAASVVCSTASGTAKSGTDYTGKSATLTWADGDTAQKGFTVTIKDLQITDGSTRQFGLNITSPTGATLGSPTSATVTIKENDSAGSLQFSAASYSTNEDAGTVTAYVTRTGGSDGAVTGRVYTNSGTAKAGTDYVGSARTLSWAAGDTAPKAYPVTLDDLGITDGSTRQFSLILYMPTGNVTIGTPATVPITINENDPTQGELRFVSSSYSVDETAGTVTVHAERVKGSTGAVTVHCATSSGTAKTGTDYDGKAATLSWADGDTSMKSFTVTLINRGAAGGNGLTFSVVLTTPGGGAALVNPSTTTVTIN